MGKYSIALNMINMHIMYRLHSTRFYYSLNIVGESVLNKEILHFMERKEIKDFD